MGQLALYEPDILMKLVLALLTLLIMALPNFVLSQDRAATERQYALWYGTPNWLRYSELMMSSSTLLEWMDCGCEN